MSKAAFEQIVINPKTHEGQVAMDMVNILRRLNTSERIQREAVFVFFCGKELDARSTGTSRK